MRRASSCAAATASWDLIVSLLKSISVLSGKPLLAVEDEVAAVVAVYVVHVLLQLPLQLFDLRVRAAQLVLEPQDELDAGEVEAELRRQPLDDPQPLDVGLRVEARAAGRALRPDEPLRLVHAQRLRMHADELGGDADHVDRAVAHGSVPFGGSTISSSCVGIAIVVCLRERRTK